MSWSINFIGTPHNIIAAIQKESERLTGNSKKEFGTVAPLLTGLVSQNYNNTGGGEPTLHLTANGSQTSTVDGQPQYGYTSVDLKNLGQALV